MPHIDPRQLNDLAALALRGGLGVGTATTDCVAQEPDQLMFIKGDQLVLLREMDDVILASCEGVVGWVKKGEVQFDQVASGSSSPRPSERTSSDGPERDDLPRTILTAPSPPADLHELPDIVEPRLDAPRVSRRVSGPFDFESPQQSPGVDQIDTQFFQQQRFPINGMAAKLDRSDTDGDLHDASVAYDPKGDTKLQEAGEESRKPDESGSDKDKRESFASIASSEALGGIGGFMMGDSASEEGENMDATEELTDDVSPATASLETPDSSYLSPPIGHLDNTTSASHRSISPGSDADDSDWDIYGDYARESMYAPLKRLSLAAKRASKLQRQHRDSTDSMLGVGAIHAARAALEGATSPLTAIVDEGRRRPAPLQLGYGDAEEKTPKADGRSPVTSPTASGFTGRSIATELRLRIMKEREKETLETPQVDSVPVTPGTTSLVGSARNSEDGHQMPSRSLTIEEADPPESKLEAPLRPPRSDRRQPSPAPSEERARLNEEPRTISEPGHGTTSMQTSEMGHALESDESTNSVSITTPHPEVDDSALFADKDAKPPSLMASPMPLDDPPTVAEPLEVPSPVLEIPSPSLDGPRATSPFSPTLAPPKPPGWSPNLGAPPQVWSPGSPASPHSIAATRHAVEAVKATPEGRRPRGLTLVGRMEADLSASKGPVPITFLIGGPGTPGMSPTASPTMSPNTSAGIGLGYPSASGRKSPVTPEPRARSPLSPHIPPMPPMPDDLHSIRSQPSKYPQPSRSITSPMPREESVAGPRPGFLAARPRSRSFSAAVVKSITKSTQPLSIDTTPPVPSLISPSTSTVSSKKGFFGRSKASPKHTPPASPADASRSSSTTSQITLHPNVSAPSLPPSTRSSSFSFGSKTSKTPKRPSRALPSPVSHRDFEDTVNAGGMDFELVQPRKLSTGPSSPLSSHTADDERMTMASSVSLGRIVPDTDEWGFIKEVSAVPEIFMSRAAPGEHRANEQKWLGIIATPLPASGPPKKVRKLVLEHGIPSSLRGRVWAWFMASSMSARVPGLYDELCGHDRASPADEQIDRDVATLWSDHSIFHTASAPGRTDLRSLLRAYSNFAPSGYSTPMCHVAGTLLIHCVAEDAFWLLSGLVNTALKEYYVKDGPGLKVDSGVFEGVIKGSEKELAALFKEVGIRASDFIERWYKQLFVRCLPWPTTLRVIDAVVSEGPRFLFIAALTILTLSKDRLVALPKKKEAILGYLHDLPQDSLLLPENFMRACEKVRFREEDYRKLRGAVEKEMGVV